MPIITTETFVAAPPGACFDMARDIDVHSFTVSKFTRERAIAGVTSGKIGPGETVTFEAIHFGIRQQLTSKVVEFDPPHRFVDEMQKGAFRRMRHIHEFIPAPGGTVMRDTLDFAAPFPPFGWVADLVLIFYMRWFITDHNSKLKALLESGTGV